MHPITNKVITKTSFFSHCITILSREYIEIETKLIYFNIIEKNNVNDFFFFFFIYILIKKK
jgi:hypothetical protein